jgi:hypothetical protein
MHFCERCQVNPAEVVVFGEMGVCHPCAEALAEQVAGAHWTGGLENVSPLGILFPPLGIAESTGIVQPTFGLTPGRIGETIRQNMPPQSTPLQGYVTTRAQQPPPPPADAERDGFPFLKVMFVLGAVGVVAVLGTALVRTAKTARAVQSGATEAIKKHPEVLMAL